MNKRPSQEFRFVHLDMVRGVAALLVCLQHLRHLYFVDYSTLDPKPSLPGKLFYLITGQGHNAVMIFFVLSGFFVAGSVATDFKRESWSWMRFVIRRLSRLYVVLIPALILTLLWDSMGKSLAPESDFGIHSFFAFGANLLFTQSIFAPDFGTNGPLWSVAYEFWYYLMFPLLFCAIALRGRTGERATCLLLLMGCFAILPGKVLLGGVIWLMGYGAFALFHHKDFSGFASGKMIFLCGVLVLALSGYLGSAMPGLATDADVTHITWRDVLTGFGFALMVPFLAGNQPGAWWYRLCAVGLSDISYTLYTVHYPALVFLLDVIFRGKNAVPSLTAYATFAGYTMAILLYATLVWWLFESRTGALRKFLERRFLKAKPTIG